MRTIKTYSKGAPFYNASAYRNLGKSKNSFSEKPISQDMGMQLCNLC
jgi:hypothetical protein